jgi:CRISPR system Cascade subunit CasE
MIYFSKIIMRADALTGHVAALYHDNAYLDHKTLWRLFGGVTTAVPRVFLFHRIYSDGPPAFYILSSEKPAELSELWLVQSQKYAPHISNGLRLCFVLRANPVVTQADEQGRHLRRDVVMVRKHALKQQGVPRDQWPAQNVLVQEACVKWLRARAERAGFALVTRADAAPPFDVQVETCAYRQHELHKRGHAPIRFSSVDFSGILDVTDAALFLKALATGVGPAKGFGCGLLLIKPMA